MALPNSYHSQFEQGSVFWWVKWEWREWDISLVFFLAFGVDPATGLLALLFPTCIMGVSSSKRLGVVALPYKAAEAEGGRGRVGGEKSQHPAAGAGWGPEAGEPLGGSQSLLDLSVPPMCTLQNGPTQRNTAGHMAQNSSQTARRRPKKANASPTNPRKAKASQRDLGHTSFWWSSQGTVLRVTDASFIQSNSQIPGRYQEDPPLSSPRRARP